MKKSSFFPDIVTRLPEADIPFKRFKGWILQGEDAQIVFLETEATDEESHSHGAEYLMLMEGEVTVFFEGKDHYCRAGDTLFIPDQAAHSAILHKPERAVGYYYDRQRFKPKEPERWADTRVGKVPSGSIRGKEPTKKSSFFPETVTQLPEADIPFEGVVGWLFQGDQGQVVFFEYEATAKEPPGSYGDEWEAILDGEMTIYVDNVSHRYKRGDSLFIPAGAVHYGFPHSTVRCIKYFADVDRYKPKKLQDIGGR